MTGVRGSGAAGATVREVMERLGHTTATVALRYQHATQERDRAIADKLGVLVRTAASDTGEDVRPSSRSTANGSPIARRLHAADLSAPAAGSNPGI